MSCWKLLSSHKFPERGRVAQTEQAQTANICKCLLCAKHFTKHNLSATNLYEKGIIIIDIEITKTWARYGESRRE